MKKILSATLGLAMLTAACGTDDEQAAATPAIVIDGETAAESGDVTAGDSGQPATDEGDAGTDNGPAGDGASSADATDEELALEFAQCMRDNGIPGFQDPVVNADGSIELVPGGPAESGIDPDDPGLQDALDACGDIVAGASFLPGADLDEGELEDNLLAFSQCLRDLGHDVVDPDMSNLRPGPDGPGGMFANGFDPNDPTNADDVETCQQEAFGATGFAGRG